MPVLSAAGLGIRGAHILCALSGGSDSVALLLMLAELRDAGEISLSAAHFEHGIRGEDSVDDMRFVKALCGREGVSLTIGRADVPSEARRAGEGLETAARRLRWKFLTETRAETGADYIALAHHLDDQAETVLMHLLRGSGLTGAAGMRVADGFILRPLLGLEKRALTDYLTARGQAWREDASNALADSPRNALRLRAMPEIDRIYPGGRRALCRFAQCAARDDQYLRDAAEIVFTKCVSGYAGIAVVAPEALSQAAVFARILKRLWSVCDFDDIERARALRVGAACEVTGGARADRREEALYLTAPMSNPAPAPVPEAGEATLDGVCRLSVAPAPPVPILDNGYTQVLSADALAGCVLRTRRAGDRISPLGMTGEKSLGDYLTDRRFPLPLRARLPLIARGDQVLWAPGVGISRAAAVRGNMRAKKLTVGIFTEIK